MSRMCCNLNLSLLDMHLRYTYGNGLSHLWALDLKRGEFNSIVVWSASVFGKLCSFLLLASILF